MIYNPTVSLYQVNVVYCVLQALSFSSPHDWACLSASDYSKYYLQFSHSIRNSNTLFQEGPSSLRLELLPPQAAEHLPAMFLAVSQPQSLLPQLPFLCQASLSPSTPPINTLQAATQRPSHFIRPSSLRSTGFPIHSCLLPSSSPRALSSLIRTRQLLSPTFFLPHVLHSSTSQNAAKRPGSRCWCHSPSLLHGGHDWKGFFPVTAEAQAPREAETIPGRPRATREDGRRRQSYQPGGTPA